MNNGLLGFPKGSSSPEHGYQIFNGQKNGLLGFPRSVIDLVERYKINLNSIGGTSLSDTYIQAYKTLVSDLSDANLLDKIVELGTFDGGFNGSKTKFIYPDESNKYLVYNSNFVSTDYGDTTGLNAPTTNRKAWTRTIPQTYGLNKDNYSLGYFYTSKVGTDDSYFMTDNKTSAAFQINIRKSSFYFNGTPLRTLDCPVIDANKPRFIWATSNGNINMGLDYEYFNLTTVPSPQITLDSEISLFGGRNGGSDQFATGRCALYFMAKSMSIDEISTLWTIFKRFLISRGRFTEAEHCVCFGDSITWGTGATVYTDRYSYVLSGNFSLQEVNLGVIGSAFARTVSSTTPIGFDRRDIIKKYNIYNGGKVIIQYGVNDISGDGTTNGDATKIADFKNKLIILVNELLILGVPSANIQIGSINYLNNGYNTTKMQAWATAAYDAAVATGVKYADVYAYTRDNGGLSLLSDVVHPNTAGHAAIAYCHYNLAAFVP